MAFENRCDAVKSRGGVHLAPQLPNPPFVENATGSEPILVVRPIRLDCESPWHLVPLNFTYSFVTISMK